MDELFDVWTAGKYNERDYHLYFRDWWQRDVTDTVLRDRNHASIVIYSAGNEIHDNLASPQGQRQFTQIRDVFHKLDPSRPVTMGILQPVQHRIFTSGFADLMDVVGVNYHESDLLAAHCARPDYKILGTENQHGASAWLALRDNRAYAGQFLWTGIDYLGEAGAWPRIGANFGLIDRNGLIKPDGYLRASWWSQTPMVYIAGSGGRSRAGRPAMTAMVRETSRSTITAGASNSCSTAGPWAQKRGQSTTRLVSGPSATPLARARSRPSALATANASPASNFALLAERPRYLSPPRRPLCLTTTTMSSPSKS